MADCRGSSFTEPAEKVEDEEYFNVGMVSISSSWSMIDDKEVGVHLAAFLRVYLDGYVRHLSKRTESGINVRDKALSDNHYLPNSNYKTHQGSVPRKQLIPMSLWSMFRTCVFGRKCLKRSFIVSSTFPRLSIKEQYYS